jgi:hypothetical protein
MAPLYPENQIFRKSNTITADKNINAPKSVQEFHMKKNPEQQSYQSSRLENMGDSNLDTDIPFKVCNTEEKYTLANQNKTKTLPQIHLAQKGISMSLQQTFFNSIPKGESLHLTHPIIKSTKPNSLYEPQPGPSHQSSPSHASRNNTVQSHQPQVINSHCFIMPEKIYDQNSRYKDTNFTPKVNPKYMQYLPQSIQPHV